MAANEVGHIVSAVPNTGEATTVLILFFVMYVWYYLTSAWLLGYGRSKKRKAPATRPRTAVTRKPGEKW